MRRLARLVPLLLALLVLAPAGAYHGTLPPENARVERASPGWDAFKVTSNASPTATNVLWLAMDVSGGRDLRGAGVAVFDSTGEMVLSGAMWTFAIQTTGRRIEALDRAVFDTRPHDALRPEQDALGLACTGCLADARHVVLYTIGEPGRMNLSIHSDHLTVVAGNHGNDTLWAPPFDAELANERTELGFAFQTALATRKPVGLVTSYDRDAAAQAVLAPDGPHVCPCWIGGKAHGPGVYTVIQADADDNGNGSMVIAGADVLLPP